MTSAPEERLERPVDRWSWPKWMIAALLLGHALVACRFLPPTLLLDAHVYVGHDYPVHAHRVHVYREALWKDGLPWGCDPMLCAGRVIHPVQDVGARPHQALGVLLPFVAPDKIVFGFTLAAVLLCPPLFVLGGRLLGFRWDELSVGLLILIALFWVTQPFQFMLQAGMASFVLCTFLGLFTLGAYVCFFRAPSLGRYIGATAAGSVLFLVHPLGPLAIVLSLAASTLTASIGWKWRVAALFSPVIIAGVNAFWLIPLILALDTPAPPWSNAMVVEHQFWTWNEQYRFSDFVGPGVGTALGLMLLAVVVQLIRIGRRRDALVAVAVGLALGASLFLFVYGSDFAVTRKLQPVRYVIAILMFSSLALGSLTGDFNRWLFLPRRWSTHALMVLQMIGVVLVVAGAWWLSPQLIRRTDDEYLSEFIRSRTEETDRLLIEAESRDSSLTQALPMYAGREVISNAFPDYPDPVQFLPQRLFGQPLGESSPREVRRGAKRFGVEWAFVRTEGWRTLFREMTGKPGESVGSYTAFRISRNSPDFLVGSGKATASVNRIELRDVIGEEGVATLRYRYHPGWVSDPPRVIEPYPIEEDPGGLLQIRDPAPDMTLRFDPLRALREPWPQVREDPLTQ
ncbi:MAG TPA: hypothetical protein VGN57_10065 [Pirellulaceae bacterium]|nr:hypothetical protein [Pirellulaceae bacterium]